MIVDFDPIALSIGPLEIRWYGLAYLMGFLSAWWWAKFLIRRYKEHSSIHVEHIDDFLTLAILGVVIGGRLGEVLLYHPKYYLAHPLEILFIWQGGMSFHGGDAGVVIVMWYFTLRNSLSFRALGDLVCAGLPIGIGLGRVANFINGELWGRVTDVSWAVIFPRSGNMLPRHPSSLYEALFEGMILFLLIQYWIFARGALRKPGFVSGVFLAGYAIFRSVAEQFREPDAHIGLLSFGTTWGQWISLPMLCVGVWLITSAQRGRT